MRRQRAFLAQAVSLAAILVAGGAWAQSSGPVSDGRIPPQAFVLGSLAASYVAWPETLPHFSLKAQHATIRIVEQHHVHGVYGTIEYETRTKSWTAHGVEVLLAPAQPGYIGVVPVRNASLAFEAGEFIAAQERVQTTLGYWSTSEAHDSSPRFGVSVVGPHLYLRGKGHLHANGSSMVKILGPVVQIQSQENATSVATGWFDGGPVTVFSRFVMIEYGAGEIELASEHDRIEVATRDSVIVPLPPGASPIAGPAADPPLAWASVALITLTGGGMVAAVGAALRRRARHRGNGTPAPAAVGGPLPTLLRLASEAEDEEDWAKALGNLQAARRLQPEDYGLAMREATCLRNLGDAKAALACYEEAALLRDTGEPYYWAAVLCVRTGNVTLARRYAEAALARDPSLAAELAMDDLFRDVCAPLDEVEPGERDVA